jgi:hypothetical protein
VRELVDGRYEANGRPPSDPIVFFKLQLIMFFAGIRSERRLIEVTRLAVVIAQIPVVRQILMPLQQNTACRPNF